MTHSLDELAQDDVRHDSNGLETKAGRRPAAPAIRTRPAAPSLAELTARVEEGNRLLRKTISRGDIKRRLAAVKNRALHQLRETAEQGHTLARRGKSDPLIQHKLDRINRHIDKAIAAENATLKRENAELRRKQARPPLIRGRGPASGLSAKSQAMALYQKASRLYLKTGQETFNGMSLAELQRKAGLHSESNPDGGFLVHPEYDQGPLEKLLLDASVMRTVCEVRAISGASFKKAVNLRGTGYEWVGERQAPSDTAEPDLAELEFPAMELAARPSATQSMLEDAMIDVESWLAEEVVEAFAVGEEIAYTSGNGLKKPKGFLAYDIVADASWAWEKIGYLPSGASGAFPTPSASVNQGDCLWKTVYALKAGFRSNASWMMNSGTAGVCRTLKDGEGRWIWADAREDSPDKLCGKAVVINEQMPAIAANSYSIAFADWQKFYIIVDRLGMTVLRDPYTNKPYVEFYTRKRVGGGVKNFQAAKLIKFASS